MSEVLYIFFRVSLSQLVITSISQSAINQSASQSASQAAGVSWCQPGSAGVSRGQQGSAGVSRVMQGSDMVSLGQPVSAGVSQGQPGSVCSARSARVNCGYLGSDFRSSQGYKSER